DPICGAEILDLPGATLTPAQLGMAARNVRVPNDAVALLGPPDGRDRPIKHIPPPVKSDDSPGPTLCPSAWCRLLGLGRRGRINHGSALFGLTWSLTGSSGRLDQPRLDAKLSET